MEFDRENLNNQNVDLEKINEELLNVLSLIILLENDMETQKIDDMHIRIIKMMHRSIRNIQKSLSENNRQDQV